MKEDRTSHLKPLRHSDYQIVDGEPDIFGWKVKSESDTLIGVIDDLLFDTQSNAVRYLIIDLSEGGLSLGHKKVMIPIGIAHLHTADDEVVLPSLHFDQFHALPLYSGGQIGQDVERQIRSIIGSPAALRMEEAMVDHDLTEFYHHHHFD